MMELWERWEGRQLNHAFVLGPFLGGSERSAVFLSEYQAQRAAVKLIPVDPEQAGSDLSRLDAAAKLSHPRLIRLLDWGICRNQEQHLLYVMMEYAQENLSQVLPGRPLTPPETAEVLASALDALTYLHSEGFVHGHLRPSNILAVGEQVKISADRLCRAGCYARSGSRPSAYDPPEAVRGKRLPAGDIWMLALTMVEMLSQRLPDREEEDWQQEALRQIPEPFVDIARNCLHENPARRRPVAWVKARLTPEAAPGERRSADQNERINVSWPTLSPAAICVTLGTVLIGAGALLEHRAGRANAGTENQASALPASANAESRQSRNRVIGADSPSAVGLRRPGGKMGGADLPEGAGGATGVVKQVLPAVPQRARSAIRRDVLVPIVVQVDASGSVVAASSESPVASEYFFDLALGAARGWRFVPAPRDDRGAGRTWILRFRFRKAGTTVQPVRMLEDRAAR